MNETNSYQFNYNNKELQQVWKDKQDSLSSAFALVQWAVRRELTNDRQAIFIMENILKGMEKHSCVEEYFLWIEGFGCKHHEDKETDGK